MNTRDHLANERTFLAWVRTGISLLGFGVLIAKLRFLEMGPGIGITPGAGAHSTRLGLAFAFAGLLTLLLAAWSYARTRRMIDRESYASPLPLLLTFAAVVLALAGGSVAYLVSILK
jgi:putative membrane protein